MTYQVAKLTKNNDLACLGNYTGFYIQTILPKIKPAGEGIYFFLSYTTHRVSTYYYDGVTWERVNQPKHAEHMIKDWKEVVFHVSD